MIKWSFSGLKDFINCPRQYHEVKVLRNFTKKPTEQMLYGTEVHKALEDYVRDGTPLAKNYERFKPMLDVLIELPGTHYAEHKMALTADKTPCDFDAEDYWVRGIADLLIVDEAEALIIDYKTGSARYPDLRQMKLMALMTFIHFPEVKDIRAGLAFVMSGNLVSEDYNRDMIPSMWDVFAPTLERLAAAYESGAWSPNPTPLCGWCPVDTCEFREKRRRF